MQLWTVQPIEWYEKLIKDGIICGDRKYIDKDWEFALTGYHWLMKKMDELIGRRPFPECYPVWSWYQYHNSKRRKPDLRNKAFLQKGKKGVRLEINKNDHEVLLSDFMLWHYPFSYHSFIGQNEKESLEFDQMQEDRNLSNQPFEKQPENIQQKIIKSWDRVLDMNFDDPYHTTSKEDKSLQATFWTLSVQEIVKVEEFTAR